MKRLRASFIQKSVKSDPMKWLRASFIRKSVNSDPMKWLRESLWKSLKGDPMKRLRASLISVTETLSQNAGKGGGINRDNILLTNCNFANAKIFAYNLRPHVYIWYCYST